MLTQKTADLAPSAAGSVFSALFFSVPISTLTYLFLTCNKSAECQEGLNLTCSINTSQGPCRDLYKPELTPVPDTGLVVAQVAFQRNNQGDLP